MYPCSCCITAGRTFFLGDGKQELTERAAAFFNTLEQATPVNEPFADFEPDIYEEELNEIVVYEDCTHWLTQTRRTLAPLLFVNLKLCTHIICLSYIIHAVC